VGAVVVHDGAQLGLFVEEQPLDLALLERDVVVFYSGLLLWV
jgi:hypothetical protein